jgi:FAD-linked oxidoreductase
VKRSPVKRSPVWRSAASDLSSATPAFIRDGRRWRNWGRSEQATPAYLAQAASIEDVVETVRFARDRNLTLKPVGAGHSFTAIAATTGVQLDVSRIDGVRSVEGNVVTFGAGTNLHQLPDLLRPYGLAMQNLGDIDRQTLAGATSTGTHGTGLRFGGLATRMRSATVVTASGELRTVTGDELGAFAVGLGALGILVEVSIECVPEFVLHALERPLPIDTVLGEWHERIADADHFEFYVWPHTDTVLTKTNSRLPVDAQRSPVGAVGDWVDDRMSNQLYAALLNLGRAMPKAIPSINRLSVKVTGDREFSDWSQRVFTSRRTVRFREMEYALPVAAVPEAIRDIRKLIADRRWTISFPIEVRATAADDLWLSTASGRESGYIAVHRYVKDDPTTYFREVEAILVSYSGRPHWGKMHTRDADFLRGQYPRFDEFLALRDRMDPDRVFANTYLDRVLGR